MTDVFGVDVTDAPEGWTPLEVVVLVKALNEDGSPAHFTRYSTGLSEFEAVGMLRVAERTQLDEINSQFEADE